MVFEQVNHTFQHPWKDVALANLKKYPNPARPEVVGVDLLKREFDPETGTLTTTRLLTIKGSLPSWLQKMLRIGNHAYMLEETSVDRENNVMVLKSRNLSWAQIMQMQETCKYTVHKENPEWTHYAHAADFKAFPYGLASSIESFCVQSFRANAVKGRDIMEQVIQRIKQETLESLTRAEQVGSLLKLEAEESLEKTTAVLEELVEKQRGILSVIDNTTNVNV